jgi:uncharacterized membrane protein YeaQ/YmgE (transglycosylase-associated protein family)
MLIFGSVCFGLVIGWVTYRTLRRSPSNGLSDIAIVIGAVGGAAITTLFPSETEMFSYYCLGLAIGFFAYLIVAGSIATRSRKNPELHEINEWLGGPPIGSTANAPIIVRPAVVPPPPPPPPLQEYLVTPITRETANAPIIVRPAGTPPPPPPPPQEEWLGTPPIIKPEDTLPKKEPDGAPPIVKPST